MKKSKIVIAVLVATLVSTIALGGVVGAKTVEAIGNDMINLWKNAQKTLEGYGNSRISYSTVISDFNDYAGTAQILYEQTLESSANDSFVKYAAGMSLTMDLYAKAFREESISKVKLATKMVEQVLLPHLESISY